MEATALKVVETEKVMTEVVTIEEQARSLKIVDSDSYTAAGFLWKAIKALRVKVAQKFDPDIKKAHELHKSLLAKKKEHDDPLDRAEKTVKGLMSDYDAEQERIRRAAEARLEAERKAEEERLRKIEADKIEAERKAEEERLLEAAAAAEKAGNVEKAEELTAQAIETTERAQQELSFVATAPINTAPVKVQKEVPKLKGGPVYREVWSAEVTDIKALCRAVGAGTVSSEYVTANMPVLNRMATALKGTMNVPGVRPVSRRV